MSVAKYFALAIAVLLFTAGISLAAQKQVIIVLDPGHGGKDQGGYDGRGFRWDGKRVPEDAYTYDVAQRISRMAIAKGWTIFFTVTDRKENRVYEYNEPDIIPAKKKLIYNIPDRNIIVYSGKEGVQKRVEIANRVNELYPDAIKIFISLHFDHAHELLSGTQIFTPPGFKPHQFSKVLASNFRSNGLDLKFKAKPRQAINSHNDLIVMKECLISPRVLIELGNFQNERDRLLMLRASGREMYARIIISAIEEYTKKINPS